LRWFRKLTSTTHEEAPAPAAPPVAAPERPDTRAADDPAAAAEAAARKRRRGSRGGRGRSKKKPGETVTAEGAEAGSPAAAATATTSSSRSSRSRGSGSGSSERRSEGGNLSQAQERRAQQRRDRSGGGGSQSRRRVAPKRQPLPAAKRELLVSVDVGEQRVAVLEDGRVAEVYLERPERRSIAGNIYKGQVDNVLPGMEAAFVEIGLEKNGFLYVDEIVIPELEGKRHGKKIQDLISRGQEVLVQAVKDPMKTKGARLTTDISLPGRFIVFVPNGEGLGVSRRLDEDERIRLRDIVKALKVEQGGVIIRTAAEGASAEDVERDLVFLQRLWKQIQAKAKTAKAPSLVYQEAELPLRLTRDLFAGDFERLIVDHERTHKRIVGYLKKTSPHMVDRVERYKEKVPLFEEHGVDQEIRSTLSRRVDLPSGGYLVFDYAEAFTVIDVNTGRFVGSRSKNSSARLEDTITKNNLEAVKEVVRQLRMRDIGGIIVIDFIDMANPKNRAAVEDALRQELERDRTKTYVVEISPLGLVEMTRQNVTDGPREILTKKCPTCAGDGIVFSEASAAVDMERKLRAHAAGSKAKAFKVEMNARVASVLIGPGAQRLAEIEERAKKRFYVEGRDHVLLDFLNVAEEGTVEALAPASPVAEGGTAQVKLVELALHDSGAAVGKLDGLDICVANAAALVGKTVKVRVERVLPDLAYGTLVERSKAADEPLTAESLAEKPTRAPAKKKAADGEESVEAEVDVDVDEDIVELELPEGLLESEEAGSEDELASGEATSEDGSPVTPKKRTRRGSRGGRRRRKPVADGAEPADGPSVEETTDEATDDDGAEADDAPGNGAVTETPKPRPARAPRSGAPRIHVPSDDLGRDGDGEDDGEDDRQPDEPGPALNSEDPATDGETPTTPKKRTRRGSRGGRRRRKPAGATATAEGGEDAAADSTENGAVETALAEVVAEPTTPDEA
jgi:ribonuclease G